MSNYQVPRRKYLEKTVEIKENHKELKQKISKTPLLYRWTMWYHSPESNNWTADSYKKIYTFSTIEEFWSFYDLIKEMLISDIELQKSLKKIL